MMLKWKFLDLDKEKIPNLFISEEIREAIKNIIKMIDKDIMTEKGIKLLLLQLNEEISEYLQVGHHY